MLIDINLLPQKEKKGSSFLFFLSILFFIVAIGSGGVLAFLYSKSIEREANLQDQLSSLQQLVEVLQQKNVTGEDSLPQMVDELETTISWAENYPISTVKLLEELTRLLPERGFIQSFTYANQDTVDLSVQFDSSRDAAYYLKRLKESEIVENASISSIQAEEDSEESEGIQSLNVLPRYGAQYTINIHKDKLKEERNEEEVGS